MKKNLRRFAPVALVFVALATLSFMAKTSISLRLRPEQGKTLTISSKANMMTMMEVQGQSMSTSQSMETRQSFTAKNVTDTQSDIETQVEAIKMTISQMGMKLEYDSEHPEKTSPMIAGQTKEFEQSLKKPVTVTYDALGHLVGDTTDLGMNQLSNIIIELPDMILSKGSKWNSTKTQNVIHKGLNFSFRFFLIHKKGVGSVLLPILELQAFALPPSHRIDNAHSPRQNEPYII